MLTSSWAMTRLSAMAALILFLPALIQPALAADTSIGTMAEMVLHLNHYPTAQEKTVLKQIIDDPKSSKGEKTLAGALIRMQHQVGAADAALLRQLQRDTSASEEERELADILLGIAHHPSADDQKRLERLIKH